MMMSKKHDTNDKDSTSKENIRMKNIQRLCHHIAKEKGFWDKDRNNGELIALMHSELSEALEWLRNEQKLRKEDMWDRVAEEMADCMIRIFDFCEARKLDLETAIWEKIDVNKKRSKMHGKIF